MLQFSISVQIVTVDSAVEVTGSTGVAAAYGVYYYLKNFCHCQFTWAGQKINLPIPLPHVFPALHIDILDRYFYTFCLPQNHFMLLYNHFFLIQGCYSLYT